MGEHGAKLTHIYEQILKRNRIQVYHQRATDMDESMWINRKHIDVLGSQWKLTYKANTSQQRAYRCVDITLRIGLYNHVY